MIKQIGQHRVRHGDVMSEQGVHELMAGQRAGIMYSDPPWGEGNIKYWATMNKKMNGAESVPADLDSFLSRIFNIAKLYVNDYLLIEYGVRWEQEIVTRGIQAGFTHRSTIEIEYRGGKSNVNRGMLPLHLHVFTKGNALIPDGYEAAVKGTSGFNCVKQAFYPLAQVLKAKNQSHNYDVIGLDPCCGMGYTAQCCINTGLAFRGNELNRKRLQKTIARLEK